MLSDGLIGALIGGSATVIVSALSQFIVVRNLNKQHAHDAKQKVEDRKSAMRRDAYLKFIEDVNALIEFLGNLQNTPLSDTTAAPMHNFLKSSSKVWLLAERGNSLLSREFTDVMSDAALTIYSSSVAIRKAASHNEDLKARAVAAKAEMNAADARLNRASQAHPYGLEDLVDDLVEKQAWAAATKQEFEAAFEASIPIRDDYMKVLSAALEAPLNVFVRLVNGLREEIGLEGDEEAFLAAHQVQRMRAHETMQRLGLMREGAISASHLETA